MIIRALFGVAILFFAVLIMLAFIPDLINENESLRTDAASQSLSCSTGAGETSCSLSLANPHEYSDTTQMTVTETSPGSTVRTAQTTVSGDRESITVAGLTQSTAYTFTVAYAVQAANVSDALNSVLKQFAPIVVIGLLVIVFAAVMASLKISRGRFA